MAAMAQARADGQQAKRQRRAEDLHEPCSGSGLIATLRGEFVHPTALRCSDVLGKGLGVVAEHDLPPGELLLRARGLRFSTGEALEEDGDGAGAAFLAEALSQLCELRSGSLADAADADALIRGWLGLWPRPVLADARAPLDAQSELLEQMLAHFDGCGVANVDELIELVVKVECNAFEGGLFPLAAMFNHSCAANCSVALRQIQLPRRTAGGYESSSSVRSGAQVEQSDDSIGLAWVYEVRSMASITAGDELCLSYLGLVEQTLPGFGRRAKLAGWGFDCACARCAASDGSPLRTKEAELAAVRCPSCAQSSRDSTDNCGSDSSSDVWGAGWCLQLSSNQIGPCLACQRKPAQDLADRLAEHAILLRDQARTTSKCVSTTCVAAAAAALEKGGALEVHPSHWLRYLAAEALVQQSQATALALRKSIEALPGAGASTGEPVDETSTIQAHEERRRAILSHAVASRDCVAWAQNAGCFAPYERGLARLLERYASALRAVEHLLIDTEGPEGRAGSVDFDRLFLQSDGSAEPPATAEQGAHAAGTTKSMSSTQRKLAAEATRVETQALEIMRVGYGGFDCYSG